MTKDLGKHLAKSKAMLYAASTKWGRRDLTTKVIKETLCPKGALFHRQLLLLTF